MPKRELKKTETRNALIKSAIVEFAEKGVNGSSINQISINAGLGKGTVYNYFKNKDELFRAILKWTGLLLASTLNEIEPDFSIQKKLKHDVTEFFRFYSENPQLAKLLIRTVADNSVDYQHESLNTCKEFLDRIKSYLEQGIENGEFRRDLDPFISAVTLWGMINHQAAFHWLVSKRPLDSNALAELVMTYFLVGAKRG